MHYMWEVISLNKVRTASAVPTNHTITPLFGTLGAPIKFYCVSHQQILRGKDYWKKNRAQILPFVSDINFFMLIACTDSVSLE